MAANVASFNSVMRGIAIAQSGLAPFNHPKVFGFNQSGGSYSAATSLGPWPESGSGSQHGSYGFNHNGRIRTNQDAAAIIANYACRPMFYGPAPTPRFSGYDKPGRPKDWDSIGTHYSIEAPWDILTDPGAFQGMVSLDSVGGPIHVSGLEPEHFQFVPLLNLAERPGEFQIETGVGAADAALAATFVARHAIRGGLQQLLDTAHPTDPTYSYPLLTWPGSDRGVAMILDAAVRALKLGIIGPQSNEDTDAISAGINPSPTSAEILFLYFSIAGFKKYLLPSGMSIWKNGGNLTGYPPDLVQVKSPDPQNTLPVGALWILPTQIAWAAMSWYRLSQFLPSGPGMPGGSALQQVGAVASGVAPATVAALAKRGIATPPTHKALCLKIAQRLSRIAWACLDQTNPSGVGGSVGKPRMPWAVRVKETILPLGTGPNGLGELTTPYDPAIHGTSNFLDYHSTDGPDFQITPWPVQGLLVQPGQNVQPILDAFGADPLNARFLVGLKDQFLPGITPA